MASNIKKGLEMNIKSNVAHNKELEEKLAAISQDKQIGQLVLSIDTLATQNQGLDDIKQMRDATLKQLNDLKGNSEQQLEAYKQELAEQLKTVESGKDLEIESVKGQIEELNLLAQAAGDEEQRKKMLQQRQTEIDELKIELAKLKSKGCPPGAGDSID